MHTELARALVAKGAIHPGIEVDACCLVNDMFSPSCVEQVRRFVITQCRPKDVDVDFVAVADKDGSRRIIKASEIVAVMGMDPSRFGHTFNVAADGSIINTGKRRGRKRKHPLGYRRGDRAAQAASPAPETQEVVAPTVIEVPVAPINVKPVAVRMDVRPMARPVEHDVLDALAAACAARLAMRAAKAARRSRRVSA